MDERRKYLRVEAEYVASCEKYTIPRSGAASTVKAKNASGGGILIEADHAYKLGDILRMEIFIPDWEKYNNTFYKPGQAPEKKPFVVIGQVVYVKELPSGKYDVGINFSGLDEGQRWSLIKCLRERNNNRSA
jgi:hypothetical protein